MLVLALCLLLGFIVSLARRGLLLHDYEPYQNSWIDRRTILDADWGRPKEPCTRWGPDPHVKRQFWGNKGLAKNMRGHGRWSIHSKQLRRGQHRYLHRCWLMRTRFGWLDLAPPDEYDWTVHVRLRCSLMSNYYDYLLISSFRHTIWQRDTSNTRCLMFEPLSHLQPLYLQK